MNANLFRLVFSVSRGMWVPAWEGARARCGGGRSGHARKTSRTTALHMSAGAALLMLSAAHAELPTPCGGGLCGTNPLLNVPFATRGRADFSSDGINALIQQHDERVILNWQSFNIGAGNSVEFKQPDAGSAALNHIWQGDASRIAGKLNANGQIYLINQNGILFDKGAQVNVHSLIASSLNIDDEIFKSGRLFSQVDESTPGVPGGFKHTLAGDDASGAIVVNVDASLTAQSGGKIMLFAPTVENSGTIQAPDGQVILAAGKKVYLQGSQDIKLRGLLVEVDGGGGVTNTAGTGTIIAERGNITLMGLAVNQLGRVSATTSVRANGSIRLLARDTPLLTTDALGVNAMKAQHTGQVWLGPGSTTQVMPEVNDSATIDDNVTFNPSFVEIMGKTVRHEGIISVPGGDVTLRALENPSDLSPNPARNDSGVYLSETSRIDVSGTEGVELPMSRNQLEVELRGDELKDYPLQRNGVLRGKTATIDVRKGTPLADVSKHLKTIPRTVAEKTVAGGTVSIESQGDAVMRSGSVIDVSGAGVHYLDGVINTTKLIAQGKVFDISVAPADLVYDGILGEFTRHSAKWGVTESWLGVGSSGEFVPGYSEGKDAGTVNLKAYGLALDGSLRGSATAGRYQRETGKIPLGGKLVVGDYRFNPGETLDAVRDAVFQVAPVFSALAMEDALTQRLVMSTDFITQGGFSRLDMTRAGRIAVPVALELPAGGEIRLGAGELDIGADISAPAGKITLQAEQDLKISPESVISARGLWVNDLPWAGGEGTGPTLIKGGTVTISAGIDLTLGEIDAGIVRPMTIDVSGGGWLDINGKLKKGDGGDISIKSDGALVLGAVLQGHALGKGGKFSLSAKKVLIKDSDPLSTPSGLTLDAADIPQDETQPGFVVIPSWMFSKSGFTNYEINTGVYGSDLTIASGTALTLQAPYLELGADYGMRASGANLRDFARLEALPERRSPVSLTLNHTAEAQMDSRLRLEASARIEADPGASVLLNTKIGMVIDGEINAPGGVIGLTLGTNKELGFLPQQAIWLGAQSRLLAAGAVKLLPDDQGLRRGEVLAGGQINVDAQRGYIVAEPGTVMDVSGTQAHLDLPAETGSIHRESTLVASSAGAINLTAAEGMLLDAALLGKAGDGAAAAGGTLSLRLTTANRGAALSHQVPFPTSDRLIVLHDGDALVTHEGVARGAAIPDALNGQAFFNAETLAQGGFERFSAQSDHEIRFQNNVDIAVKRSVVLDAPALNAFDNTVNVNARYVALGSSDPVYQNAPPATSGAGKLNISADLIDLFGNSALQGTKETNLHARGDIRLRGVLDSTTSRLMGSLSVSDDLNLQARQVYPTTLSEFEIKSSDGTVKVLPDAHPGGNTAPVLSAGGKLTLSAPRIENHGVLKAPLGEIALNGSGDAGQIVLGAESQTSVSAEGLVIPYGKTQNGKDWVYGIGTGIVPIIDTPPKKNLRLTAANIDLRAGAEINLSGNGDLYAYEFIPGPGGSKDVLDNIVNGKTNNTYAILPALGASFAPYDPQYYSGSTLAPGDSVYLSAAEGLAAGFYTLLPPRYALLPGAYLVTARSGYQDIQPGQNISLTDGSQIVAGKHAAGTDILASRWSGFSVSPAAVARTQAEYQDRYANTFFTEQALAQDELPPLLPGDAGRLIIAASQALTLDATLQASHVVGGRGAAVDIAATQLAVGTPQTAAEHRANGFVTLDAASLTRLGAESLLLGGTRRLTNEKGAGEEIQASSTKVIVANDAAHALAAPEIILVANDQVQVQAGSVIEGVGAGVDSGAGKREKITLGSVENSVDGDGALLRVASGERLEIVRHNTDRASGTLDVESGALLSGTAVELDATQTNTFNGTLTLTEKGSLSLGAGLISFGETASVTEGLVFSPEQFAALNTVGNITLRSYSTVDFWGDVNLGGVDGSGNPLLSTLFVEAGGINGYANAGKTASINVGEFSFTNPGNVVASNVVNGGGTGAQGALVVTAQDVMLGEGDKTLSGFDHVKIAARNEITAQGKGTLAVPGTLVLEATRLGAAKRADQAYTAAGDVTIVKPAQPANLPATSALAAQLAITGSSIHHAGQIDLPSGKVTLTARTGDVILANEAQITTQGVIKNFDDVAVSSPAGKVSLVSDQGNVEIQRGALVDVSGIGSSGDAGTLSISAIQGRASLQGQIKGGVADNNTGRQGRFVLDANLVNNDSTTNGNDFTALNQQLNEGEFNSERTVRLRGNDKFDVNGALVTDVNGDVVIEANSGNNVDNTVKAHTFRLTADNGKIDVLGRIDASGEQGGIIALSARDDVTLHGGSRLEAKATGVASTRGGQVELATTTGMIDVQDQSAIDVSGGTLGGRVLLRAPATVSDVKIAAIAGTITGASDVTVEAVKVYQADTIDSSLTGAWQSDLSTFMDTANIDAIKTRLNKASDTAFHVVPGLEVQSAQTLTLASDWDLSGWRFGSTNEPGVLTLRAADSLTLDATLSDGFAGTAPDSLLQADRSWSYRLVGGADLSSADTLALLPAAQLIEGSGDVIVAADKLVRTGSGTLDIAAGGNFELGKDASGINQSTAAVYTAGQSSLGLVDFTPPKLTGKSKSLGNADYPAGGGDIRIQAGKNVKGAITHQLITEWLQRQGQTNGRDGTLIKDRNPSWWVNFSKFQQNIGALGGGNVSVTAANDIDNLSVVIPTTGRLAGAANTAPLAEHLIVTGGGDLRIEAGGDILSGIYYVGKGLGTIRAGGALEAGRKVSDTNPVASDLLDSPVHAIFALGDGKYDVRAGGDIEVETVLNPTVVAQESSIFTQNNQTTHPRSYFFTYAPDSTAEFTSLAGDATFVNGVEAVKFSVAKVGKRNGINFLPLGNTDESGALSVYPGAFAARALAGDVFIRNNITLFPSASGNLQLLAAGDVDVQVVNLSDADPALLLNPLYIPATGTNSNTRSVLYKDTAQRLSPYTFFASLIHADVPVHVQDTVPVRVVASSGDIKGTFYLSKKARLIAGQDIRDISFEGQHVDETDVTFLQAGRDIFFDTVREGGRQVDSAGKIILGGPGRLEVRAGRHVNLGNSNGIVSRGNLSNPNLSSQGADVTVMAGVAEVTDYESFIDKYFNSKNQLTMQDYENSNELAQYIKEKLKIDNSVVSLSDADALQEFNRQVTAKYAQELTAYMRGLNPHQVLTQDEALTAFKALTREQQWPFITQVFYSELRDAGRDYHKVGKSGYARGYEVIATLFPEANATGDLSLLFSQIKTEAGGDINIYVPRGKVNAGQTTPPAESGSSKTADQLGITAQSTGAVRAFVKDDFAVNESRVFTLGGGDILMWSSDGDIDAGKGAKTAVSAPPPVPITDKNGITTFKFLSVAGSGIRSILVDKETKPGDVDLIAPNGEVNAGDAGIGAAGNLNIAALRVVGADNIQVGGISTGVPVADTGSLGGSLSGVSSLGGESKIADQVTQDMAKQATDSLKDAFKPSFLTVEVIGHGD